MEFANMSGLDVLDEIFDTADARAVGVASEEPVADVDIRLCGRRRARV